MAPLVLSREQAGRAVNFGNERLAWRSTRILNTETANWITRYTFYAFIFSLPFEESYLVGGTTLSKLFGLALAGFALFQPRLCYQFPPKAFWWFVSYLLVVAVWISYLLLTPPNVPEFSRAAIGLFVTLGQLLVLFWISYNLLKQERLIKGALWALVVATIVLAALQILGVTGEISHKGRVAAFAEQNPNGLATVLSLGLLALFGLAYGREKRDWKGRVFFWLGSGILAMAIVQTGSRGAVVALAGSLSVFFLRGKTLGTKLKFGLIAFAGIVFLAGVSYQIDAVRIRWEKTFYDEDIAGRDKIYAQTMDMILESPLIGWGPVTHLWELGPRVGTAYRDEHNVYLWILAEVGFLGAVPFFVGLGLCVQAAWRARHGSQGILPLVMLLFLLVASMKSTLHKDKHFWLVLSLALVARSYSVPQPHFRKARSIAYAKFPPRKLTEKPARVRARLSSRRPPSSF